MPSSRDEKHMLEHAREVDRRSKKYNTYEYKTLINNHIMFENLKNYFKIREGKEVIILDNIYILNQSLIDMYRIKFFTFNDLKKYLLELNYTRDCNIKLRECFQISLCKEAFSYRNKSAKKEIEETNKIIGGSIEQMIIVYEDFIEDILENAKYFKRKP
tara:strand:+ start:448 stop:924 length:477 start_codon:yes stop_codon:yes gene_type:complete